MATTLLEPPAIEQVNPRPLPLHARVGMTGHPPVEMSYADFLQNKGLPHKHFEYVEGKAVEMPAVSDAHDQLTKWLIVTMGNFVLDRKLGQIKGEPWTIHIPATNRGRAPDVMVVLNDNVKYIEDNQINGPADLVVEVASPSTSSVDRGTKFREYQSVGVREYWLVHPLRPHFEPFVLEEGRLAPSVPDANDVYHSVAVPGLWYKVDWFRDRPAPSDVIKAWEQGA
ncbi:MAG: Uma2 family endonuclease [Planctomycetota bacterium]